MSTITAQIQLRRDTVANWTLNNPILLAGEIALSTDLLYIGTDQPRYKIGNGIDNWLNLDYIPESGAINIATYENNGVVRLATQEEVDSGTENGAVVLNPDTFENSQQLSDIRTDISNLNTNKENVSNKTDVMSGNTTSSTKYLSAKGVYDWVIAQAYITSSALSGYATQAWVNSQGFITNVITALGYTPANKAGETFTGSISATNLSGTNTGDETNTTIKTKLGASSTSTDGYLTSTDWNTFNNKQSSLGYTAENISNKSSSYTASSTTTYANTKALVDGLATKQNSLGFTPENSANKGVVNGYASLNGSGQVPSTQLPSYVDDVIEVANYAALPVTGETGKIYITLDTNNVYRWSGSVYVQISQPNAVWGSITGTLSNQTDLNSALNGKEPSITSGTTSQYFRGDKTFQTLDKSAVGLSNVDNTSDLNKPISTATQTALNGKFNNPTGTSAQYIDGTGSLQTFPTILDAGSLITEVYNNTGSTLTKGTIVYINGGQGNLPTITKALANSDTTSAQTFGWVRNDITNNNNGYVIVAGKLNDLNTNGLGNGTQLYLSPTTLGAYTTTKPYAPYHLVYVGIVVRDHPTQGVIEVKIQNGYELDELHNVQAQSPSLNDTLYFDNTVSPSQWKTASISTILGFTPENVSNKSDSYTVSSSTTYATSKAVVDGLATKQDSLGYTAENSANKSTSIVTDQTSNTKYPSVKSVYDWVTGLGYLLTSTAASTYQTLANLVTSFGATPSDTKYPSEKLVKDSLDAKVTSNTAISGATKTKITYDSKGLVTNGADATTADISDSTNKRYVTDANLTVIGNTSGTNTGDETTATIQTKLGTASTSTSGYLTSTDWNTFNGKQSALVSGTNIKTVNSTSLLGSGDVSVGTVTNVSALTIGTTGTDLSSSVATGTTTPVITLNVPTASATNRGVLSSSDWSTFNGKQGALTLTTTGTSGAATLVGSTLNVPNYATSSGTNLFMTNGDVSTSSATGVNLTDLTTSLAANKRYYLRGQFRVIAGSSTGIKVALTIPTGASMNINAFGTLNTTSAFITSLISVSGNLTGFYCTNILGSLNFIQLNGEITTGANSGSLQFVFAGNGSSTSTCFQSGTYFTLIPLT